MFLFRLTVLLRAEADDWEQFFHLAEHPPLDDFADFLVARPSRILATVVRTLPQAVFDDFIPEILGVSNPRGLFDFRQFLVEGITVEQLPSVRVLEVDILDPSIGIGNVPVEQVLAIIVIGLQVRFLDLVADEFRIARGEFRLDELQVPLLQVLRHLVAADRLLQHIHQMHRVGSNFCRVVVEGRRQHLEGEAG